MSAERFRYDGYDLDPATGRLECRYSLGSWQFTEEISFELPEGPSDDSAARGWGPGLGRGDASSALHEAARVVCLLAGVSYYKTAAPKIVDLGDLPSTPAERAFLRMFFVEGLAEFAYRNGLGLTHIEVTGPDREARPVPWDMPAGRPLVPFGAGIDSIVTVEAVRRTHPDLALFVVGRGGERFDAIERTACVTGLPVARAERRIDPAVLGSASSGFLNGHVPVTGILSAIAVMAAVLGGFGSVVMSNEWSASAATLEVDGRPVNHQWSKGLAFERGLRDVLAGALVPPPAYFSFLRARTELWVASQFAALERYHGVFRSCNRAFYTDPARRLDHWCGECDKCCFIDLILSPFLGPAELQRIFDGHEPLATGALAPVFRSLLGVGTEPRPFECVGDTTECRTAAVMAAGRADRASSAMLQDLATWARQADAADSTGDAHDVGDACAGGSPTAVDGSPASRLFERQGPDFVPADFARGTPAAAPVPGSSMSGEQPRRG